MSSSEYRPQTAFTVTYKCGHTFDRKTRIQEPGYIEHKQRIASLSLCSACRKKEGEEKARKLEESIYEQIQPDATDAEKAVFTETFFGNFVTLIVSRKPFTGALNEAEILEDEGEILETVPEIRKRTVEKRLKYYAQKYPDAHIALFSTSSESDGMPIYVYN